LCLDTSFFSSRRRHTRFSRDWSSDVCSSDLEPAIDDVQVVHRSLKCACQFKPSITIRAKLGTDCLPATLIGVGAALIERNADVRSEERSVGKESGSR